MMESLIKQLLTELGEDPEREGLARTPERVARSLGFLTEGYNKDPAEVLADGVFTQSAVSDEMVVVKDIEMYSLCEHHMLPFYGKAHIAYLPKQRIIGLSKVARLVDVFSRRLQVQERLTNQIAEALVDALDPMGVGVIIEAAHLCMMMRGVQKQNSVTVTSCVRGRFKSDARTRAEFIRLSGC